MASRQPRSLVTRTLVCGSADGRSVPRSRDYACRHLTCKYFEHRVSLVFGQHRALAPTNWGNYSGQPVSCTQCSGNSSWRTVTRIELLQLSRDGRKGRDGSVGDAAGNRVRVMRPWPGSSHVEQPSVKNISNPGRLLCALARTARLPSCSVVTHSVTCTERTCSPVGCGSAPIGLLASWCFRQKRMLSCLTCHDPHENVAQSALHYVANKCNAIPRRHHEG